MSVHTPVWITLTEAARILGLNPKRVSALAQQGRIGTRKLSRRTEYYAHDVTELQIDCIRPKRRTSTGVSP